MSECLFEYQSSKFGAERNDWIFFLVTNKSADDQFELLLLLISFRMSLLYNCELATVSHPSNLSD